MRDTSGSPPANGGELIPAATDVEVELRKELEYFEEVKNLF